MNQSQAEIARGIIQRYNRNGSVVGHELTRLVGQITGQSIKPTNCGSCLRRHMGTLMAHLEAFDADSKKNGKEIDDIERSAGD